MVKNIIHRPIRVYLQKALTFVTHKNNTNAIIVIDQIVKFFIGVHLCSSVVSFKGFKKV